jgi:hypothetical protein
LRFTAGFHDFVFGDVAGPAVKIAARHKNVRLFRNGQKRFLHHVIDRRDVRAERGRDSKPPRMTVP